MGKVILAFAVFFAGLLLFGGAREALRLHQESQWPTVTGVVQGARLFEAEGSNWIDVSYSYTVDGQLYTDMRSIDTDQTRRVPDGYREPAEISVRYDPLRPDRSYLEHPGFESPIALTIFGIVVLVICSPFIAKQLLLVYADMMLRKAKCHMREGLKALEELEAMRAHGERVPQEFLDRESEAVEGAQEAYKMLEELERQRDSLE